MAHDKNNKNDTIITESVVYEINTNILGNYSQISNVVIERPSPKNTISNNNSNNNNNREE